MIKNAKLMHSSPSPGILETKCDQISQRAWLEYIRNKPEYPNNLNKDGGTHFIQSLHGLVYSCICQIWHVRVTWYKKLNKTI